MPIIALNCLEIANYILPRVLQRKEFSRSTHFDAASIVPDIGATLRQAIRPGAYNDSLSKLNWNGLSSSFTMVNV